MKLSIITINKNNAKGLEKTILSVINQSFDDFEYIVIDGQSEDSSVEIIRKYSNKITYWISEPDSGVFNAMNKGIRIASGEYILFLNSGDFLINEDVLEAVFSNKCTADFLCARCAISENGKIIHVTNPPFVHTFNTYFHSTISHQATFIKRSLFEKYGYYREDFKIKSDWEFWIRTIILNNCSTQKIDVELTNYNLEGISNCKDNDEIALKEIEIVFSNPLLQKFVPDYNYYWKYNQEIGVFNWLKSKQILYYCLIGLYNFSHKISKLIKQ